jgi:iron(III) transport system ATP-binding protein
MSVIYVIHNKDEVFTFADKIAVMHQGSIIQTGSPGNVCQSPNSWQTADFIQLGSWIPVKAIKGQFQSAIGEFPLTEDFALKVNTDTYQESSQTLQLLLKPQSIEYFEDGSEENNIKVDNISFTNRGLIIPLVVLKAIPLCYLNS